MEAFEILQVRGHIMGPDTWIAKDSVVMVSGKLSETIDTASANGANPRRSIYAGGGPVSHRGLKVPQDFSASRRMGLKREVCMDCAAVRYEAGNYRTQHARTCVLPGFSRQTTGPLRFDETSRTPGIHWR